MSVWHPREDAQGHTGGPWEHLGEGKASEWAGERASRPQRDFTSYFQGYIWAASQMCERELAGSQTRGTGTLAEGLPAAAFGSDTELLQLFHLFPNVFKSTGRKGRTEARG